MNTTIQGKFGLAYYNVIHNFLHNNHRITLAYFQGFIYTPLWLRTSRIGRTPSMEFICYGREIIYYIIVNNLLLVKWEFEKFDGILDV